MFKRIDMLRYSTNKKFDIIIFCESLYYLKTIEDVNKIINTFFSYLNSNGIIIYSYYYKAKLGAKIEKKLSNRVNCIEKVSVVNKDRMKWNILVFKK